MENSKKYYKLNYSQHMLFFSQKFSILKQVNTICTSYLLKMDFDEEILKKAIITAYQKQEAMRLRLAKINKETVQYIADYEEPEIKVVDFSKKTKDDEKKYFSKIAHKCFTKLNKNMNAIYIVHSQDGYNGLALAISHLAMDSFAVFGFYKLIVEYYMHYKEGAPKPTDPASYTALLEKELKYEGSAQHKKDIEFWEEFHSHTPPVYTDIRGPFLLEKARKKNPDATYAMTFTFDARAKHVVLKYEKDLVDKMEAYRAKHGVSVQAVIGVAMSTYVMAFNDENEVTLMLTYARRATLSEKTGGGSRVHAFPHRQIFNRDASFADAVADAYNQQCTTMHHLNFNTLEIFDLEEKYYKRPVGAQYNAINLTYQPIRIQSPNNVKFQIMWYGNGAASQPLYPTIMDGNGTGELHCYYEYKIKCYKEEEIRKAHEGFVKVLNIAMDNPEISLNDIIKQIKK